MPPLRDHLEDIPARVRHIPVPERAGGNRSLAARLLGIDRGTLARKLRALGLEPPPR